MSKRETLHNTLTQSIIDTKHGDNTLSNTWLHAKHHMQC